ncbi:hypothetical protein H5410_009291 [Solanum commersonii]|uniref:Uncharacterized protein n=1 Tax=Solanum commersonii TaxID=4109 RepID=A0A9J6AI04_SOLCO|nr:hypothetical protein H5410_009291 [Solanum commersonii]
MVEDHLHSAELHGRRRCKSPASSGLCYLLILLCFHGRVFDEVVYKFSTILTVISMLGGLIDQMELDLFPSSHSQFEND